jgi:hypothetical protein
MAKMLARHQALVQSRRVVKDLEDFRHCIPNALGTVYAIWLATYVYEETICTHSTRFTRPSVPFLPLTCAAAGTADPACPVFSSVICSLIHPTVQIHRFRRPEFHAQGLCRDPLPVYTSPYLRSEQGKS